MGIKLDSAALPTRQRVAFRGRHDLPLFSPSGGHRVLAAREHVGKRHSVTADFTVERYPEYRPSNFAQLNTNCVAIIDDRSAL
jgi:hypothetical protein